jgi:tripartite-type tricarboxylate transporter receptor subunit TctC
MKRFPGLLVAALLAGASVAALAQSYPAKPIRWIVPFPPGGSTDLLARVVGQKLTEEWGQPVLIENRGGAGGTLGTSEAALPGFEVTTWFGALAPAKTPPEIVARLQSTMVRILAMPEVNKRLLDAGAEPVGSSSEQMAAQIQREIEQFGRLVRQAKITVQ